jgi:hypothetical protein
MQPFPELSDRSRQLLDVILRHTALDGSTLMKESGVSRPSELVEPIRELQRHRLIEVGGPLTSEGLPFARFAIRPSAKEYLHSMLR